MTISKLFNEPKILNKIVGGLNLYDLERTELTSQSLYRYAHLEKVKRAYAKTIKQFDRVPTTVKQYILSFLNLSDLFISSQASLSFKWIIASPIFFKMKVQQSGENLSNNQIPKNINLFKLQDVLKPIKTHFVAEYHVTELEKLQRYQEAVREALLNNGIDVPEPPSSLPKPDVSPDSLFKSYIHSLKEKPTSK
jgi:hypothetical protein